jgi:predicted nucleic acid-binding Zn ribbon protein
VLHRVVRARFEQDELRRGLCESRYFEPSHVASGRAADREIRYLAPGPQRRDATIQVEGEAVR